MAASLKQPVFFIGFMGAGKTSAARRLAQSLGLSMCDIDRFIETQQGRKIAEIFATDGESAFRNLESAALAEIAQGFPQLVSCGGGVVERPKNIACMQQFGTVVYLQVDVQTVVQRIGASSNRPLFNAETAQALHARREALYRQAANFTVDTTGRSVAEVASKIREELVAAEILSFA